MSTRSQAPELPRVAALTGVLSLLLLLAAPAAAQESAHYKIESGTFNGSGLPLGNAVAQSSRFILTLDAAGQAAGGVTMTSPSLNATGGLAGSFPPPGEVQNLRFLDPTTLQWNADPYAAEFALYKGTVGHPFDPGFGTCTQPPPTIAGLSTTVTPTPSLGQAFFYLVTGRNQIALESTKGVTSAGVPRANSAPCP